MILSAHVMLAALVNVKELELSEEEARKLSEASKEVLKHYPLGFSDKTIAWVNLTCCACGIYAPRFMAYGVRRGTERRARVVTIAPPNSGPAAAPPAAPPVNGHAMNLTPDFMTAPPEGEVIP